jgi:hypothetical protein
MRIRVFGSSGAELPGHRPPSFLLNGKILFDIGSLTNILPAKDLLKLLKMKLGPKGSMSSTSSLNISNWLRRS